MPEKTRYRARTLFEYIPEKGGVIPYVDSCYIFRDGDIWVALSLGTSKICEGESVREAYLNLVLSIVRAIRRFYEVSPDKRLVLGTKQPEGMRNESLTGSRLKRSDQSSYLKSALLLLAKETSKPFSNRLDHVAMNENTVHGVFGLDCLEEPSSIAI